MLREKGPAYLSAAVQYENAIIEGNRKTQNKPFKIVAIYPKEGQAQPTNYIGVASVTTAVADVERLGGTLLHRFTVPGMGYGAITLDPEGNSLGLWQPDPEAAP